MLIFVQLIAKNCYKPLFMLKFGSTICSNEDTKREKKGMKSKGGDKGWVIIR